MTQLISLILGALFGELFKWAEDMQRTADLRNQGRLTEQLKEQEAVNAVLAKNAAIDSGHVASESAYNGLRLFTGRKRSGG